MNKKQRGNQNRKFTMAVTLCGILAIIFILVFGTIWMGRQASRSAEEAVRSVSLLYLDELAGRREQVVADNLHDNVEVIQVAISLMTKEDLSDAEHLQAYQARMKHLFKLEKFAFVGESGLIYTSTGIKDDLDAYPFDPGSLREAEIHVKDPESREKKVIIAVPIKPLSFNGETLTACFMEINMDNMLAGVSMSNQSTATFCNLYTKDGIALSDTILGGLAVEDNLLEALRHAQFEGNATAESIADDFANGRKGVVSFTYDGILETLSYVPVEGTDWLLTYLIRESVISENISSVTDKILRGSFIQSALTLLVMLLMFLFIFFQLRKNAALAIEKESSLTEIRVKRQELEDRQALNEALSEALKNAEQANKAKTAFLSNMSHEIRTPMNAIIGLDSIAINDPETPEKTRGYLEKIGASANHLLTLINDILDMSRIESGRMTLKNEEFSFSKLLEVINTMFSGQCLEKGLSYQCYLKSQVDDCYIGDSMKLRQVLINILGNAVKFTPPGGQVEFTTERIARFDGKTTLRFRVADTGIGMSEEFLPHIFDTFSQEDSSSTNIYGSSGLGLAITRSIVEMMNGDISVESEKGKGTTFTVTVTLADAEKKETNNEIPEIGPQDMTVLVIDDDPIACEHAKLVLGEAGIAAETATSGEEGIEKVRLRHARREAYNLILVDWKMPEMDGIETTQQIRSIVDNESAIVILTAYRWDEVLEKALEAGVDSFIPKPLFAAVVLEEFRSALQKKNRQSSDRKKKADLTGRRILLAEDMQVNAEIMTMVLQVRQMEVECAANGRIAVEAFSSHPAGYYDAILMDMRMPEMDGLTATQKIRSSGREDARSIPIIALTANAFDEDVQRSLQAGLNAHLSKPVEPEVLYETLEYMIGEREQENGDPGQQGEVEK